jgi:hypothetical protein
MIVTKNAIAKMLATKTEFTDHGDILFYLRGGEVSSDKENDIKQAWKFLQERINRMVEDPA